MTTDHPGDGRLQAYLDQELPADGAEAAERHLLRCPSCRTRADELSAAEKAVSGALAVLHAPEPTAKDRESLLWEVRRRHAERRSTLHRRRLAVAASTVLLLAAGAAAAMPGSPVRGWLSDLSSSPTPTAEVAEAPQRAALGLELDGGAARVEIEAPGEGLELEVRVTPGERVDVEAPESATFRAGAGWVRVAGAGPGTVRVEMPASARRVEVVVGGRVRAEVRQGRLFVDGAAVDSGADSAARWIRVPDGEGGP